MQHRKSLGTARPNHPSDTPTKAPRSRNPIVSWRHAENAIPRPVKRLVLAPIKASATPLGASVGELQGCRLRAVQNGFDDIRRQQGEANVRER